MNFFLAKWATGVGSTTFFITTASVWNSVKKVVGPPAWNPTSWTWNWRKINKKFLVLLLLLQSCQPWPGGPVGISNTDNSRYEIQLRVCVYFLMFSIKHVFRSQQPLWIRQQDLIMSRNSKPSGVLSGKQYQPILPLDGTQLCHNPTCSMCCCTNIRADSNCCAQPMRDIITK